MFYHDLLKKELLSYINSEYSEKNIKEFKSESNNNFKKIKDGKLYNR